MLPPQKPGSYVLGVLTGQIGQLRFRSHSYSKGGPADSDDFMSYEKPARPILKVLFLCIVEIVALESHLAGERWGWFVLSKERWGWFVGAPSDKNLSVRKEK